MNCVRVEGARCRRRAWAARVTSQLPPLSQHLCGAASLHRHLATSPLLCAISIESDAFIELATCVKSTVSGLNGSIGLGPLPFCCLKLSLFLMGVGRNYITPRATIIKYSSCLVHTHTSDHTSTPVASTTHLPFLKSLTNKMNVCVSQCCHSHLA